MINKKKYIALIAAIFLLLVAACSEEKKSTEEAPAVSKKIEKKIEQSKTEPNLIKDKEKAPLTSINEKATESIGGVPAPKISVNQALPVKEQMVENKADGPSTIDKEYDPTGKLNPFLPFVSDEAEKVAEQTDNQKKKRTPLTPLEKIDIGQLRLTAITRTPSGNIALVEEASGKGYVLNEGTYIGLNAGKVISVLSDKVVIEEEIENIFGKVSIQERELKLQKPTGE